MPQSLTPPVYSAAREGLIARYTAAFSGDNIIALPLYGSFQGDPVHARSLLIDNYNNGVPVSYTIGGLTDYVSAYTAEYIDVSKMDTILLSAPSPMGINLSLYNTDQTGSRSRGLSPSGTSDPLWSNVVGLWHFDANPGATIAVDSKNAGHYLAPQTGSGAIIVSTDSLFGGTSGFSDGAHPYSQLHWGDGAFMSNKVLNDYTFEIAVKAKTLIANTYNLIAAWTDYDGAVMSLGMGYSGSAISFVVYKDTTQILSTGFTYDTSSAFSWHRLAVTTIGGFSLWVDGSQVVTTNTLARGLGGAIDLFFEGSNFNNTPPSMWVDEMRMTLGTRYTKNYTPDTAPFPNQ